MEIDLINPFMVNRQRKLTNPIRKKNLRVLVYLMVEDKPILACIENTLSFI